MYEEELGLELNFENAKPSRCVVGLRLRIFHCEAPTGEEGRMGSSTEGRSW